MVSNLKTLTVKFTTGLTYRLLSIGRRPICNLHYDRAPHWRGICFPLCWRCTSIIISFEVSHYMLAFSVNVNLLPALFLCLPMTIDGIGQYFFHKESTNMRRIWTGVLAGIGLAFLKLTKLT